jgi:hypothetical protein
MEQGFPGFRMSLAAIDRLVHHATIFGMNVESYRRRAAQVRRTGAGRPGRLHNAKGPRGHPRPSG